MKEVNALIDKEIAKGIPPERIFLCGFSQGAGIAFHTCYNRDKPLGGLIAYCGCLPNDQKFSVKPEDVEVPCMWMFGRCVTTSMFHGTADKHVPYQFIQRVPDLLKSKGVKNVTLDLYPGVKHTITRRMLDLTKDFVTTTLNKK